MRKIRVWMPAGIASPSCKLILRGGSAVAETIVLTEILPRCYEGTVTVGFGFYNVNLLTGTNVFGGDEIMVDNVDGVTYEAHMATDWSNVVQQLATVNLANTKIGGYTGDGAFLVEVTVRDINSVPIPSALVRFSLGLASRSASTNASGYIAFSLDAGTWTISITKPGYSFTPVPVNISANVQLAYQMSVTVILPPANPALTTGFVYCYDTNGNPETGVVIVGFMTTVPSGTDPVAHDSEGFELISASNGLASHPLVKGATYKFRRGTGKEVYQVALDQDSTPLPPLLGMP